MTNAVRYVGLRVRERQGSSQAGNVCVGVSVWERETSRSPGDAQMRAQGGARDGQ